MGTKLRASIELDAADKETRYHFVMVTKLLFAGIEMGNILINAFTPARGELQAHGRIRFYLDDKVHDSKDKRESFAKAPADPNTTPELFEQHLREWIATVPGEIEIETLWINGTAEDVLRAIENHPMFHIQMLSPEGRALYDPNKPGEA